MILGCVPQWSCSADADETHLLRRGRFGIFRDLVLFQGSPATDGPFFLDRFETTRRDFAEFLLATSQPLLPKWSPLFEAPATVRKPANLADLPRFLADLPMVRITLAESKAFARWRFGHVSTLAEWRYAATGAGRSTFPWGNTPRVTWANTGSLGFGQATPVGTFESGPRPNGPYDLVGNVAEWTTTPNRPMEVILVGASAGLAGDGAAQPEAATPVRLAPMVDSVWAVGGHFAAPIEVESAQQGVQGMEWMREEWADFVGLRVVASPLEVLVGLAREAESMTDAEERLLTRFLATPGHEAVLREAWADAVPLIADDARGPLFAWLDDRLAP